MGPLYARSLGASSYYSLLTAPRFARLHGELRETLAVNWQGTAAGWGSLEGFGEKDSQLKLLSLL